MTETALSIYQQFGQLQQAAGALYKSGYFSDAKSEAQAMVKVMAGAELGIPPFASMTGINIIQGKPALGSNIMATLVKNDPRYDYKVAQCDNTVCVLHWYEGGKKVGESAFTFTEAQTAGLTGKDNWKKYPSDMLFARAISRGVRRFAPGVFGGAPVYTPEELGAEVDEDGVIIEGSYAPSTPTVVTKPDAPVTTQPETAPQSFDGFRVGDEVIVAGKNGEKPGVITGFDTDGDLVLVNVDGKVLRLKAERLVLAPDMFSEEEE